MYDYQTDVIVRLYHTVEGASAKLVDIEGKEVGILKVDKSGKLSDPNLLKGASSVETVA